MKLLNIVVPVFKVQGYLRQCLDSMLEQSFADFEIVAVDDCSPDYSGAILAEYAARDERVRVVTLTENVGLGRARNIGLEHAAGEYVWFVDSDDWLAEGALKAVAERLVATDADVLVGAYDKVFWNGRVETVPANSVLGSAPDTFTMESWPRINRILHVAWNRVVRRDLLVRLGFQFEQGWYEDVSFTFPVMAVAQRITAVPRVLVHYRQRRSGAITKTAGDRHFEIFDHWGHALALVDEYSDRAEALRPLIFARMMWHYLSVLRNPVRRPHARGLPPVRAAGWLRGPGGCAGDAAPAGRAGVVPRLPGGGAGAAYGAFRATPARERAAPRQAGGQACPRRGVPGLLPPAAAPAGGSGAGPVRRVLVPGCDV
jgi:CDP-glycerol glycerophosphotransferase